MIKSLRYIALGFLAVIVLLASAGCHHGDEETTYMEGDLDYHVPYYLLAGTTFTLTAGGITDPDPSEVTYYWYSSINEDTITGPEGIQATFTIPDSIALYSIVQKATSTGHYATTATQYVNSIIPYIGGSLKGVTTPVDSILDSRDGQYYYITEAGNLQWFAENLNYAGCGTGYMAADDAGYVLGRLYTWDDATGGVSGSGLGGGPQGACPEGWSVPTNEDWEDLAEALGGKHYDFKDVWKDLGAMVMVNATFNGDKFWEYNPKYEPQAKFGWDALAAGYCLDNYHHFYGLNSYAFFWSSTEMDSNNAYYRYIYTELPNFPFTYSGKNGIGASVRCVKQK